MKKISILLLAFFIIISSIFLSLNVFGFACTVRFGSCNPAEICLFSMYYNINSHAADCSTYLYKVCCDFAAASLTTANCTSDQVGIINLNKISNSHVEFYGLQNYPYHVCVNQTVNQTISCAVKQSCNINEACVASLYSSTNSHVAQCGYYSNNICCKSFAPYTVSGIAYYADTGLPITNGTITGIIEETGETAYATIVNGYFVLKSNTTLNATESRFTLGLIVNSSDNKIGYVELVPNIGAFPGTRQACSTKQWHFSGTTIDNSGNLINSGTVMVSVNSEVQTYINSTSFSNGSWDIYISPCLISGNLYTFQISVSSGGNISTLLINQVAK